MKIFEGLSIDENRREMIRSIKSRIIAMLEERERLQNKEVIVASPGKFWSDICSFFDYMLWLPEESFSKLRLHTYHLTGDIYLAYYFDLGARSLKDIWKKLVEDIPSAYILYEPEGGIGYSFDNGKVISLDVLRYQFIVNTFYRHGIISSTADTGQQRKLVLEIGAGYGGLAHQLTKILGNVTYIIVDLPETLLFSASYLSLLNPNKRIYVYGQGNFAEFVQSDDFESYDFVLIPNYKLDELRSLRFDLVINVASFQEMRADQVNIYLDFIAQTCRGVFYSWNQDAEPRNDELGNLSEMLRARFELVEAGVKQPMKSLKIKEQMRRKLRRALESVAILVGPREQPAESIPALLNRLYREYICEPLRNKDNG